MQVKPLESSLCGVEITGMNIATASKAEILEVGRLAVENLLVVIRNQHLTPEEEVAACSTIGEVEVMVDSGLNRCPEDARGNKIRQIQRVTGQKYSDGTPMGLFGHDHDLEWHANRPSADKERKSLIWLYSCYGSKGTRTSWINCLQAFKDFDPNLQNELRSLSGIFGFEPNRYTSVSDFKSHRNMSGIPIVQTIKGTEQEGLFFPFLQLFGFKDKSQEYSDMLIAKIKNHILQDKYIYHHEWEDGDIIISEQWLTIHKRWACDVSNRMLHRISFDYDKVIEERLLSPKSSELLELSPEGI